MGVKNVGDPDPKYWVNDKHQQSLFGRHPNFGLITEKDGKTVHVKIDDTSPLFSTLLKQTRVQRSETAEVLQSDLTRLMKGLLDQRDLKVNLTPDMAQKIIYIIGKEYHAAKDQSDGFVEKFVERFSRELSAEFLNTCFNAGWANEDLPQTLHAAAPNTGWTPNV
jgi:hypothetical protein